MQVVLLEDLKHARFGPLTLLRPEFDLRCGALELREKLEGRRPDWFSSVGIDFFRAFDIRVLEGRPFDIRDTADGQKVAVISDSMAKRF